MQYQTSEKIQIEKGTVQETLIVPLYARKKCTDNFPQLYSDNTAAEICGKLDHDFPDVIETREKLGGVDSRETNIISDLTDHNWMEKITAENGAVFYAAGVFHYLKREDLRALVVAMAEEFPGVRGVHRFLARVGDRIMKMQIVCIEFARRK